jgi:hypothetical protein
LSGVFPTYSALIVTSAPEGSEEIPMTCILEPKNEQPGQEIAIQVTRRRETRLLKGIFMLILHLLLETFSSEPF